MAVRAIVTLGGPKESVLRARAKKVSRFDETLRHLVDDMWETMRDAPGVGLAAPQLGASLRVLVAEHEEESVALVNPEIIKVSEERVLGTEGCLSIPGLVGDNVSRASSVIVKGRDPHGKEIRVRAEGWFARILQHEIDHLDGILYIDHIKPEDVREATEEDVSAESEGGDMAHEEAPAPVPAAKPTSARPASGRSVALSRRARARQAASGGTK